MSIWSIDPYGLTMNLIWNMEAYQAEPQKVYELTNKILATFKKLVPVNLPFIEVFKNQFCVYATTRNALGKPMSPTEILAEPFFQSLQKPIEQLPTYYWHIREIIALHKLEAAEDAFPACHLANENSEAPLKAETEAVKTWTARLLACYMTEPQVTGYCNAQRGSTREIRREKSNLSTDMMDAVANQTPEARLTFEGFQTMLATIQGALANLQPADNPALVMRFTARYLNCFALYQENSLNEGFNTVKLLPLFQAKVFPNQAVAKRYTPCVYCGT